MESIAALAARKAKLEAELSALREEIASRAGQTDEPPPPEALAPEAQSPPPARAPARKGKGKSK